MSKVPSYILIARNHVRHGYTMSRQTVSRLLKRIEQLEQENKRLREELHTEST